MVNLKTSQKFSGNITNTKFSWAFLCDFLIIINAVVLK